MLFVITIDRNWHVHVFLYIDNRLLANCVREERFRYRFENVKTEKFRKVNCKILMIRFRNGAAFDSIGGRG